MVQLRLKKPKALLFDISGTVAKTSFIDKVLLPYITINVRSYLEQFWNTKPVNNTIEFMKVCASEDSSLVKIDTSSYFKTIDSCEAFTKDCIENKKENKAITLLK